MLRSNHCNIHEYMRKVLENYEAIRSSSSKFSENVFWDAVIISASDFDQEIGYKFQISKKKERREIPSTVPFHVFSDPPGYKIGCGGSTMYILNEISKIYGSTMSSMRFLLIPAGGYSQRLPNLTILGKLFSPLPFGKSSYQMLDLILASYLPFLKRMSPGVFLSSSDAIISYSISDNDEWTFCNDGFTALAHPSPVEVGRSHGVYVLPENTSTGSAFMSECLCVLQKPSTEEMHEKGAVLKNVGTPGLEESDEIIFSDSAFFFDHTVAKLLIELFKKHQPLKCELSSYGDFLRPLGSLASPSYIKNSSTHEELLSLRTALYKALCKTQLSVCVLTNSNFHHLGTMQEYIDSLCNKNNFSEAFPVSKFSRSSLTSKEMTSPLIQGTVINSIIHPLSAVPSSTLIEYCDINIPIEAGRNSIISNACLTGSFDEQFPVKIPDSILLHTVLLNEGFVTVAFNIQEDIKKSYKRESARDMNFFGQEIGKLVKCDSSVFSEDSAEVTLWDAKLFPICDSSESSFRKTLELVICIHDSNTSNFPEIVKGFECISMKDVMKRRDTKKMILYQENLCLKLSKS